MPNDSSDDLAAIRNRWENVPDYRKMIYLYDWCQQLADAVELQEKKIRGLQAALRKVESGARKKSSRPKH